MFAKSDYCPLRANRARRLKAYITPTTAATTTREFATRCIDPPLLVRPLQQQGGCQMHRGDSRRLRADDFVRSDESVTRAAISQSLVRRVAGASIFVVHVRGR